MAGCAEEPTTPEPKTPEPECDPEIGEVEQVPPLHAALCRVELGRCSAAEFGQILDRYDPEDLENDYVRDGVQHTLLTHALRLYHRAPADSDVREQIGGVILTVLRYDPEAALRCCKTHTGFSLNAVQMAKHLRITRVCGVDLATAFPQTESEVPTFEGEMEYVVQVQDMLANRVHVDSSLGPADLDGIFLGNSQHAADIGRLQELGITHVLNLAPSMCFTEPGAYLKVGMKLRTIDAADMEGYDLIGKNLKEAVAFIKESLDGGGKCLVHCFAGINRSATISIAYLMVERRMPLFTAVKYAFDRRPCILWNSSFQMQLVRLAHSEGLLE